MGTFSREIEELEREIREKKKRLEAMREEEPRLQRYGPEYTLAVALHQKFCHWNHIDVCGWRYEIKNSIHDWTGSSHKMYLEKAQKVLNEVNLDVETILKVVGAL